MGGGQFAFIRFSPGILEPNPCEERGVSYRPLLQLKCCFVFCALIRISLTSLLLTDIDSSCLTFCLIHRMMATYEAMRP
jgi:hypothetical protein